MGYEYYSILREVFNISTEKQQSRGSAAFAYKIGSVSIVGVELSKK